MNPVMMMDPVHVHTAATSMSLANGFHQQEFVNVHNNAFHNNSFEGPMQNQNGFYDQRPRHFTPPGPVLYKRDHHIDAHVSGDDFERSCVIYVAGLNSNIDDQSFADAFRQFGSIVSCIRRSVDFEMGSNGQQQYAFIRFSSPQEAQYAIQCGEVEVNGRKLLIKPRDKKGARSPRHASHGSGDAKHSSSSYGSKAGEQILRMIKNQDGAPNPSRSNHSFDKRYDGHGEGPSMKGGASRNHSGSTGPPVLMSKSLHVANLPDDMDPKELYNLFLDQAGPVDGVYIFPMCDQAGRRYGHIVMKSFYSAQKAVETLNGMPYKGYTLEVSYASGKPAAMASPPASRAPVPTLQPMYGPSQPIPIPQVQGSHFHLPQQHQAPVGWIQQGMGPTPRPFVGMPQYGLPQQPIMPGFSGQGISYGQQAMDFPRYNSPPITTPSPPGFTGSPDQRYGKQRQRQYGPPPGLSAIPARHHGHPASFTESRSFSDSTTSTGTMASSLPTSVQESPKQMTASESIGYLAEEESKSNFGATSAVSALVSDSGAITPSVFKIATVPVIPEVKTPYDPCNLFVKNLDDAVIGNLEDLKKIFEPYGQISSAFLATYPDSNITKGYGFVAFAKREDAENAKEKLQNSFVGKKRLFISWAERKEERSKRLKLIIDGKQAVEPEGEGNEEKKSEDLTAEDTKEKEADGTEGAKKDIDEQEISAVVSSDSSSDATNGEQTSISLDATQENASHDDKIVSKENKLSQKPPTVGSVKGWASTPLTGIAEVEEEKKAEKTVPSKPQAGKTAEIKTTSAATPGNKRNSKKTTGSQKVSSAQIQTAVPNFGKINSLGRAASSRIPVQGAGTPTKVTTPPTGPRQNIEANGSNQVISTNPPKKRGYKANRQARAVDKDKNASEGASTAKNAISEKKVDKPGVTVTAH